MSVYTINGTEQNYAYSLNGTSLQQCYWLDGTLIPLSNEDYDEYHTEYQHAILDARDEWKVQYRADDTVIPLVLHTDQHYTLDYSNAETRSLFAYLSVALKWNEISACVGLGDVDMTDYTNTFKVLSYIPTNKQINIWGNHDLWHNYVEENNQFVIDWNTNYFDNSAYTGHAFGKKGIEYHIDSAHNVKYVCLAGWEIDKSIGGKSEYIIGTDMMDAVIDILEMQDGYDIVILSHCTPISSGGNLYKFNSGETWYSPPTVSTGALTNPVDMNVALDDMLVARNSKTSGTITDVYGVTHSYDFSDTTGNIICTLLGHGHTDAYGYSSNGGILSIMYDAFAYGTKPFYLINIDRTNGTVDEWKITDDAVVQSTSIPLTEQ